MYCKSCNVIFEVVFKQPKLYFIIKRNKKISQYLNTISTSCMKKKKENKRK